MPPYVRGKVYSAGLNARENLECIFFLFQCSFKEQMVNKKYGYKSLFILSSRFMLK
jgi:hypothetical protein